MLSAILFPYLDSNGTILQLLLILLLRLLLKCKSLQYLFRSFRPDFVLTRERMRGVEPKADARNFLFGLMHGNVPSLNSLEATYSFMEKPLMVNEIVLFTLFRVLYLNFGIRQQWPCDHFRTFICCMADHCMLSEEL